MVRIALCEDEQIFREAQEKLCKEVFENLGFEYSFNIYNNAESLLLDWEKGVEYDFLLLDIIMEEMNGLTLAKKLREKNAQASIIFITSNPNFALQGYEVEALHYLLKPLQKDILLEIIQKDYNKRFRKKTVAFDLGSRIIYENIDNIIYIESNGRFVEVVTMDKTFSLSGKISDIHFTLPNDYFYRCHKGFVVNKEHIREIGSNNIHLTNNIVVPIGRTFGKEFKTEFLNKLGF